MSYVDRWIVMGRDECNDEWRPSSETHLSEDAAYAELTKLREVYVEARSMWVEMLKDKAFYQNLERECHEEYWDEEYDPDFY